MNSSPQHTEGRTPAQPPLVPSERAWIALAGNPNCGKTTLFNRLTGSRYKVANYPGVTVERKGGTLQLNDMAVEVVDLPGIYSLAGTSADEHIAIDSLTGAAGRAPSAIIAVVDSTNLERNLFLVSQLIDCGAPVVVALNMSDEAEKSGIKIYKELLARLLDVEVVRVVASRGHGVEALKSALAVVLRQRAVSRRAFAWAERSPLLAAAEFVASSCPDHRSPSHAKLSALSLISGTAKPKDGQTEEALRAALEDLEQAGVDPHTEEASLRYRWIGQVVSKSCLNAGSMSRKTADAVDTVLTHKIWGSLILVLVLGLIFQAIFLWSQGPMDLIEAAFTAFAEWVGTKLPPGHLKSLFVDGIIAGVGSIVVFVPQIAVLFLCLGLLEDSGYLSRAAFVLDRVMRRFGLQGRSFIPLLSSFACAVPGIMAARTIPSFRDRLTTIMVAPFMSCSARLPVYSVLIGAFIPRTMLFGLISLQGLMLLCMYLLGIAGAAFSALVFDRVLAKRESAPFVMEMPPFRTPGLTVVLREVLDRIWIFIRSAGTVILACSIVLWFLASYPQPGGERANIKESFAGRIGSVMEPVIKPLGFNWEIGIGILSSFAAREVFVSSLATVYSVQQVDDDSASLIETLKMKKEQGTFTVPTALSLLVFYVFACQCISTLAVCRRETGSWGYAALMFGYMTLLAYTASFITYQTALRLLG